VPGASATETGGVGLAIEARGLEKRYGEIAALRGVDLAVPVGACFGLLGPNGAGKTTTVGILTTLLAPTAGSARLCGFDVVREQRRARECLGVVFQESTLDRDLSAREHLDLYARLYHVADRRRRVDEILALIGLVQEAGRPARQLSGGQKRRLEIGCGLLHRPRVLFLDEPTLGLDVLARSAIWQHLRALRREHGTTIFLTTHSMEEADGLCDRLAIVDAGRVVAEGSPEALKRALGGDLVLLRLERGEAALERLGAAPGVRSLRREPEPASRVGAASRAEPGIGFRVTLSDGPRQLAALLEAAAPCGVLEVALQRPTLEHVFLHHAGRAFAVGDADASARESAAPEHPA